MESDTFRTTPGDILRKLTSDVIARWWWIILILVSAVTLWAIYDLRAIYIGLMLIFIIFPTAMLFAWFSYGMSPSSVRAVTPKRISLNGNMITITYISLREDGRTLPAETIDLTELRCYAVTSSGLVLRIGDTPADCLSIPESACDDQLWSSLVTALSEYCPGKSPDDFD